MHTDMLPYTVPMGMLKDSASAIPVPSGSGLVEYNRERPQPYTLFLSPQEYVETRSLSYL